LTAGNRRNDSSKSGLFRRAASAQPDGPDRQSEDGAERYTGRHASPRGKAARKSRVGKVVPAAAVAAAVAAGTAAYSLASGGQPQAAQFNAGVSVSGKTATPAAGGGQLNGSGSMIRVAQATASEASRAAAARAAAKPTPSHTPAATPSASSPSAARATATPSARATTQAATPSATATSKAVTAATLSCNLNYSMLPQNVTAIVSFLLANGYTHNAAAGIAGNIYQESKGNPESVGMGGGGLIGWTPLQSGMVTGNPTADLQTQLNALLTYNKIWSSYIPALNAASSPSSAAYIYVTDFERAGIPAAATREASASNVASACGL
jgi:tail lysozyme